MKRWVISWIYINFEQNRCDGSIFKKFLQKSTFGIDSMPDVPRTCELYRLPNAQYKRNIPSATKRKMVKGDNVFAGIVGHAFGLYICTL